MVNHYKPFYLWYVEHYTLMDAVMDISSEPEKPVSTTHQLAEIKINLSSSILGFIPLFQ